jgi:hypothetical protein
MLSHAPEDFLDAEHEVGQVDALGLKPAIARRRGPIIVARSQGQAPQTYLSNRMRVLSKNQLGEKEPSSLLLPQNTWREGNSLP